MIRKYTALMLLLFPTFSHADMGNFAKDYLDRMENSKSAVFYATCKSKTDGQYTATLIFEAGSKKGFLTEKKNKVIINLATVIIDAGGGLTIEETHGGVYTYDRVKKLIDELVGYKFIFLSPLKVKALESNDVVNTCTNVP